MVLEAVTVMREVTLLFIQHGKHVQAQRCQQVHQLHVTSIYSSSNIANTWGTVSVGAGS